MNDDTTTAAENQPVALLDSMPSSPAAPPKTNSLAIVALIAGFVIPLAAFICGGIALSQIKRTGDKGRGLAWSGIIVGAVMSLLAIVVSILIVVGTAAAVQSVRSVASQTGSLSASETPGCDELTELVNGMGQQMAEAGRATGEDRAEAISEIRNSSDKAHALAASIADPEVADAAESAVIALDDVVEAVATARTEASTGDAGTTYEALAAAKEKVTVLSAAMTKLETACR